MLETTIDFVADEDSSRGTLTVKWETPDWDQPVMVATHYPIMRAYRKEWEEFIGKEARQDRAGLYAVYYPEKAYRPTMFRLLNSGATLPIKTETYPIPPPKTRAQLRYSCGRWEKYLKSGKGWTPA